MKKIIFSLILSTFSLILISQTYNVTISGTVTDLNTGDPVIGQEVYISTDSIVGGFTYYNSVITGDGGYFEDNFDVPVGQEGFIIVSTMSCGAYMSQTGFFSPNNNQLIFDFQVCTDPGGGNCQAMFTYYPGGDSLSIQFMDESIGNPDNWYWEFGDGNTSNEQNPLHIYPSGGEYMTTLTIWADSCTSTMAMLVFVMQDSLPGDCQAMFFSYPDSNDFYTINFIDMSIAGGNPQGIPDTWYWDFGDGNTSTLQNPVNTYSGDGDYMVCLTITSIDNQGSTCESTECQNIYVGSWPNGCEAAFSYYPVGDSSNPGGGWNGLNIQFLDMSFGNPDSWVWSFGDGTSSNERNPVHLYAEEGNYNVCLSISNLIDSCESISCNEVFVFNDTTNGCIAWYEYQINDLTVDFQAYLEGGSNNVEFTWSFGDGTSGTGANITHTYSEDGIYNVMLLASDSAGCNAEYVEMIWVGNNFTFEVYGYIYLEDSMMADFADVHLMTFDTLGNGLINLETTQIDGNGFYIFDGVGLENCVYFVQAELTDQSNYFGDYIPTYHLNAINWEEAWPILPFPSGWTSDVHMVSTSSSNSGDGIITGTVVNEGNRELLSNVEIILLDQQEEPIIYSRTNEEGFFNFGQLAYGTYIVYTEIVGIETLPFEVTLSEGNSNTSVNIVVQNGQAFLGVHNINSTYIVSVDDIFPNPATDKAAINISIKEPSKIKIEILNQYGQNLYINDELFITGHHTVSLPTLSLSQGCYFVRITDSDNISTVRKLIKLR
jgi:PKD repeat protein